MNPPKVIDSDLIGKSHKVYLIGIGGAGMSALARVLKHRGLAVAGSDRKETPITQELVRSGIPVFIGQTRAEFGDSDLIIYSSAIQSHHTELKAARASGRSVFHRAEILSSLLNRARTSVAVTGTHGKTTTSSMISFVLSELGKNPTCLIGSELINLGTNTVLGNPNLFVAEVDESDRSHCFYAPNYAVVTNLEEDHLDNYKDLKDLESTFDRFFANLRNPGVLIYCGDDPVLGRIVPNSGKPHLSYGFTGQNDYLAQDIHFGPSGSEFDLYEIGFFSKRMKLSVPGLHNVANALGCIAVLLQLGIEPELIYGPLSRFSGTKRRLEVLWESADLTVIDDYAHHPTEVRASIRALRQKGKSIITIFQPHRFSRTWAFAKQFGMSFEETDELILTDVYGAGEDNPHNIGTEIIYQEVVKAGHPNVKILRKNEIIPYLLSRYDFSGIVAFLGAGDIGEVAYEFANRFKSLATA